MIVSARFEGRSAIERQRLVYAALAAEMGREIHALSMQTLTPAQWREQSPGSLPSEPAPGGGNRDSD